MRDTLVAAYATPVPRYTSYPTAPHFGEKVDAVVYGAWLSALPRNASVSLYLHIPYCDRLCWFCGCHTKQVRQYAPIAAYLLALRAEIGLVAARIGRRAQVSEIHFGGGSPTMLAPGDLKRLMALLVEGFDVLPDATISIEIDPGDITDDRLDALRDIGVNRASIGVQDFNPTVQHAINRIQSLDDTRSVIDGLRQRGISHINIDMLYGLPHQSEGTVVDTARQVLALEPDRIALFGYAHVPWLKKHQRLIDQAALPEAIARFAQAQAAASVFVEGGMEPVGMDHFARPGDSLALAAIEGTLRRNFQGYTTDTGTALIGFGASAISELPQGYAQNAVPTADYARAVHARTLPTVKGVALTDTDRMHAYAIERIMCDFRLSRADLLARFGNQAQALIARAETFIESHKDGFFERDAEDYRVTPAGRPFVRHIAAIFDEYLPGGTARYSIAV